MLDSLELFEEISHNAFLENTEFILFLNKHDLFVEKLKTSNLSACFPDYDGKLFVGTCVVVECHLRACVRACGVVGQEVAVLYNGPKQQQQQQQQK